MLSLLTLLGRSLPTQTQAALPSWVWLVVAAAGILAFAFYFSLQTVKQTKARLQKQLQDFEALKAEKKELSESARKANKKLDGKRDDIDALKRDLAAQKKKNHSLSEDLKNLRDQLRDEKDASRKLRDVKPAFAEPVAEKPKEPKEPAKAKPEPKPEVDEPKVKGVTVAELQKKIEDAQTKIGELKKTLHVEREKEKTDQNELKAMRKRIEDYRRIDMISKSKMDVLEDRLHHMGRQYYDTVSELAVLKGEVAPPPRPRQYEKVRDDDIEITDDSPEADEETIVSEEVAAQAGDVDKAAEANTAS